MSDQEVPIAEPSRGRAMPLVVLLVIVLAAAAAAYVVVTVLRAPRLDPAALIPKEVAAAVTVDFTKSQDKDAAMRVIRGIFEECGVNDPEQKLFESIDEELGIKVATDVLPKLSGLGGVAVLTDMTGFMPSVAMIAGAKSDRAAADLLEFIAGKLKAKQIELNELEYEGFTYYRIAQDMPLGQMAFYLGAVKGALVGTIGESAFKKVADTAKGKPSLMDDENFQRLRKTSDATFASVFFSGAGYYKLIGPLLSMGMGMMAPDAADTIKQQMENHIASVGTAEASGEGIKLAVSGVMKEAMPAFPDASIDELASIAPKGAALVCAVNGVDVAISELKKQLSASPGFKTQIDQLLAQARQTLKMDPYAEALDRIKTLGFYYVPKPASEPQALPGTMVLAARVDKPAVIVKSLAKIHAALGSMGGVKLTSVPVGGLKVAVGPVDERGTRVWDALSGDKLIVGITGVDFRASAREAIAAADRKGPTAASSPGFELVKRHLPARSMYLLYGDAGAILNTFKKDMSVEDRKIAEAITKTVGTFGATGSYKGTEYEALLVAPFRK